MKKPFNKQTADMICEMIASNNSLVTICNIDYMPDMATITEWLLDESPQCKAFKKAYDFAKEVRADYLFEEIIDIADDNSEDEIEVERRDGSTYTKENREFINRSKVRIQTRLEYISKSVPKKYSKDIKPDISDRDKLKELIDVLAKGPVC